MSKVLVLFVLVAVLASGCSERSPIQTADWYLENDAERRAMVAKCDASPGELSASPNCINAKQATNKKENARRGYVVPKPIDLSAKEG